MFENLSKSDLKLCSLKGCLWPAAFEIFAGPNHFDTTHHAYACALDRVKVMGILSLRFPSVEWHDVD